MQKTTTPFVVKADEAQGIVEAIVNTTGGDPDRQNDVVVPGAWRKAIAALNQKAPKVVWSHQNGLTSDKFTLAGKVIGLRELMPGDPSLPAEIQAAGRGALIAKMQFNRETGDGREAYSNVAGGFIDEWSCTFMPDDASYNKAFGYNEIRSAFPLIEVSPVLMGASVGTGTLAVKSAAEDIRRNRIFHAARTAAQLREAYGPSEGRTDYDLLLLAAALAVAQ